VIVYGSITQLSIHPARTSDYPRRTPPPHALALSIGLPHRRHYHTKQIDTGLTTTHCAYNSSSYRPASHICLIGVHDEYRTRLVDPHPVNIFPPSISPASATLDSLHPPLVYCHDDDVDRLA